MRIDSTFHKLYHTWASTNLKIEHIPISQYQKSPPISPPLIKNIKIPQRKNKKQNQNTLFSQYLHNDCESVLVQMSFFSFSTNPIKTNHATQNYINLIFHQQPNTA